MINKRDGLSSTPGNIFVIYILITLGLYYFGPIYYEGEKKLYSVLFMAFFLIIARFFYFLGTHVKINGGRKPLPFLTRNILRYSIIYAFILQALLVLQNSLVHGVSISSIFQMSYLSRMAETYTAVEVINTPASWLMSYTGWIKLIALIGGSYYGFKDLKKIYMYMYFGLVALIVINTMLFLGSQKQLIDLIAYILIPFVTRKLRNRDNLPKGLMIKVGIGLIVIMLLVGTVIQSRFALWQDRYNSQGVISFGYIDTSNWMYKILPTPIRLSVIQVINYISQGYCGLALCLELPFVWSKGMGFSFKFMNDISDWFHIPISSLATSYPVRMQEQFGVRAYAYWHTIFPWWASDFTWFGAIIIVSIFVYYWGKAWREQRSYQSLPSILLFSHLTLFVLYIPCNNQLFQTRESIVSTLAITFIWFLYHGRPHEDVKQEILNV